MEISRTDFRVMFYYDYKKGLNFHQYHASLANVFGDSAPCLTTIKNW